MQLLKSNLHIVIAVIAIVVVIAFLTKPKSIIENFGCNWAAWTNCHFNPWYAYNNSNYCKNHCY